MWWICGVWRWPWAATASLCVAGVVEGQWGARLGGIGGSASRWGGGGKLGVLEAECGESGWTWAGAASAGAQSVARKGAFVGKRTGGAIQQTLSVVLVLCPRLGHCLIQRSESGHCPRLGPKRPRLGGISWMMDLQRFLPIETVARGSWGSLGSWAGLPDPAEFLVALFTLATVIDRDETVTKGVEGVGRVGTGCQTLRNFSWCCSQ